MMTNIYYLMNFPISNYDYIIETLSRCDHMIQFDSGGC